MQVVLLAGGFGTRISEESIKKPKPMVELGGKPIILHIMEYFSNFGFNDFIICAGYKQDMIKNFFHTLLYSQHDIEVNFLTNKTIFLNNQKNNWKVKIIDTGLDTATAGRIKKIEKYVEGDDFWLTYGDGLSNVDLKKVLNLHQRKKPLVTLTSIEVKNKFGILEVEKERVKIFSEKKDINKKTLINGGFMILNKKVIKYIKNDSDSFEFDILPILARKKQVNHYFHSGFWKCMDTLKDKNEFEEIINSGKIPWVK